MPPIHFLSREKPLVHVPTTTLNLFLFYQNSSLEEWKQSAASTSKRFNEQETTREREKYTDPDDAEEFRLHSGRSEERERTTANRVEDIAMEGSEANPRVSRSSR